MLSCDLENLAAHVRNLHPDRAPITQLTLEVIANQAESMADRARALEAHTVPFEARHEPALGLDPRVVPLRRFAAGDVS